MINIVMGVVRMLMTVEMTIRRGLLIISSSFMAGKEHFMFQTQWMANRLLSCNDRNKVYTGRLVSDVIYRFFENGYLLSTSMFCDKSARWVPVQLSWICGLAKNYYCFHFAILFQQFQIPSILIPEQEKLACQVVDFSLAQKEGFIQAYMEVFRKTDRQNALKHLKGCHEHFWAQVMRVKRNRAIIASEEEVRQACLCFSISSVLVLSNNN
jgi:hypothetical protein